MQLRRVRFWALPVGVSFWYSGNWCVKTDLEQAIIVSGGDRIGLKLRSVCLVLSVLCDRLCLPDRAYDDIGLGAEDPPKGSKAVTIIAALCG